MMSPQTPITLFPHSNTWGTESDHKSGSDALFAIKYPLRILIAEDNYICRRVLTLMLERYGYSVTSVEDGQKCLNEAIQNRYDLIFLNIEMPSMDGIECTRCLRNAGVHSSIVAVTATHAEHARLDCLAAGMNGYIEKPVTANELKRALRLAFLGHIFAAA